MAVEVAEEVALNMKAEAPSYFARHIAYLLNAVGIAGNL
jgi:hypothetical protein